MLFSDIQQHLVTFCFDFDAYVVVAEGLTGLNESLWFSDSMTNGVWLTVWALSWSSALHSNHNSHKMLKNDKFSVAAIQGSDFASSESSL